MSWVSIFLKEFCLTQTAVPGGVKLSTKWISQIWTKDRESTEQGKFNVGYGM